MKKFPNWWETILNQLINQTNNFYFKSMIIDRYMYIISTTKKHCFLSTNGLLFVKLEFSSHSMISHSFGDVTIAGEEMQILTYARHLWQLSNDDSLACRTYVYTGHPFIRVISEDPWHSHFMLSVWQWSCHHLFLS